MEKCQFCFAFKAAGISIAINRREGLAIHLMQIYVQHTYLDCHCKLALEQGVDDTLEVSIILGVGEVIYSLFVHVCQCDIT